MSQAAAILDFKFADFVQIFSFVPQINVKTAFSG